MWPPDCSNGSDFVGISYDCVVIMTVIQGGIGGIICLTGIIGNCMAFTLLRKNTLGDIAVFTLKTLSLFDALMLLNYFSYGVWPWFFFVQNEYALIWDVYAHISAYTFYIVSILRNICTWLTVLICHQRFLVVTKPLEAKIILSLEKTRIQVSLIIILSFLFGSPSFFETRLTYLETGKCPNVTVEEFTSLWYNATYQILYKNVIMVGLHKVVPIVLMLVESTIIISQLRSRRYKIAPVMTLSAHMNGHKDTKITTTLLTIVAVYIITHVPNIMLTIIKTIDPHPTICSDPWSYAAHISNILVITNSTVNVFIYYPCSFDHKTICCECCNTRKVQPSDVPQYIISTVTTQEEIIHTKQLACSK